MLEAKLEQAALLKKVIEAIRELVSDCNFDCSESGIALQAIDSSHIALVSLLIGSEGFSSYRSDRNITLGININSMSKVLRCAANEDILILRANDQASELSLTFEDTTQDRISEFTLKLMNIDQEHLSIPESEYTVSITMPTAEFQRICRDLRIISESVKIEATKDGVRFIAEGDIGNGAINIKPYSDLEKKENSIILNVSEPVSMGFNLQYLNNICKGGALSQTVTLQLCDELPIEIEYKLPNGHLRYYLAPKIDNE